METTPIVVTKTVAESKTSEPAVSTHHVPLYGADREIMDINALSLRINSPHSLMADKSLDIEALVHRVRADPKLLTALIDKRNVIASIWVLTPHLVIQPIVTSDPVVATSHGGSEKDLIIVIDDGLYKSVAGQYVILKGMTLDQMNRLISSLLLYPPEQVATVHNFFSHLIGLYRTMLTESGDLANTLRSEEMRLLWTLLQPTIRQLEDVSRTNCHYATAGVVLDALNGFRDDIIKRRDDRLATLKAARPMTPLITAEIEAINKGFARMKKVDDLDRVLRNMRELMETEGINPSCRLYLS